MKMSNDENGDDVADNKKGKNAESETTKAE